MTINELNKLQNEENFDNALEQLKLLSGEKHHIAPLFGEYESEKSLNFLDKLLNSISDKEVRQMIFVIVNELAWYEHFGLEDVFDSEYIEKIIQAEQNDRLIISPFAIGDKICKPDDPYPMEVKAIIYDESGIHIKTERYECVTSYDYKEHIIEKDDLEKYQVSNEDCDECPHVTSYDW